MDSTLDIAKLAAEFVVAYYTTSVYDFRSTIKFYDPEKALIYRQTLPDGKPSKVNEAKQFIALDLRGHERLIVLNYSTNPLPLNNTENQTLYFNVAVIGKIVKNEKEGLFSQFSQFFTLEIINNERIAIISDSLTVIPQINSSNNNNNNNNEPTETNEHITIPVSEILFEIDHRPTYLNRQNQSRRQQQQQNQATPSQQQQTQQPQTQQNEQLGENKPPNQTTKSTNKKKSKNSGSNRFVYTPED